MKIICKNCQQEVGKVDSDGWCTGCNIANETLSDLMTYSEKEEGICDQCGEYFSLCDCPVYCHDCDDYHSPSQPCD